MTTTVASIADAAFDGVAAAISGVIHTCVLTRTTLGAYDPSAGSHATTTATSSGRAVFDTSTRIEDALPGYVAGPTEKLVWLEGLSIVPMESDAIAINGTDHTIKAVGDIAGAGSFFAATVIPS